MQRVHLFVHQAGRQQRDAYQEVPCRAESGQGVAMQMADLVNEQKCAVERKHGHHSAGPGHQWRVQQDCAGQCGIADAGRQKHVGPVDFWSRFGDVAGQFHRSAKHGFVVRNIGMHTPPFGNGAGQVGLQCGRITHASVPKVAVRI